jgi:O-methyltransferase domain/Dimerisation domain
MSSASAPQAPAASHFVEVLNIARSYMQSACLYAVAKLKVADFLAGGPQSVAELARAAKANEDGLYRTMRALASIGVFHETAPRTFANTPVSDALRSEVPGSARDAVLFMVDAMHLKLYGDLAHSVETGGPVFKKVTGMEPFEFFMKDEEENRLFNAAMTSIATGIVRPVIEAYDFGESGTIADVGGGHGALIAAILTKHRGLQGILYDLPPIAEGGRKMLEARGVASRCQIVGGDFFKSVPPADQYVMKSVIHDWDDPRAITILKNCASALRNSAGKICLLEMPIGPMNEPGMAKWIDLEMLAVAGGRERTEAEYAELFSKAGLRLSRVVRTASPIAVIEAVKA